MPAFNPFRSVVESVRPTTAVVLGSGLSEVASGLRVADAISYTDIPGLVPPSVLGHRGQLTVGHWNDLPSVICSGRVHYYEGHSWEQVTALVRLLAEFGVRRLILTNAAGAIRHDLNPGDLMAIRGHIKLLDAGSWRKFTPLDQGEGDFGEVGVTAYSWIAPQLPSGVYAALTGPCYETPAEIRALRQMGADAVGMSTAMEAEAAMKLGMKVAGISCITNLAAGLAVGTLSHHEVEATARTAVDRLRQALAELID